MAFITEGAQKVGFIACIDCVSIMEDLLAQWIYREFGIDGQNGKD